MAREWSSEHVVADHRDLQASTFSIDSTGQYAVLAGRRHIAIVHLDNPGTTLYRMNRTSKWDISTTQWSPHHKDMFVVACNQRAELFTWQNGSINPHSSLKAHTRAISDLDWSTYDANLLATSSMDTYIHLWDIRDSRKPSLSLSAVAGAFQVKWNRILQHMIATSHEGDIRLWDARKGTSPVEYITAHLSKIHSIDWCPTQENMLATSSQDNTVKFWDVTSPKKKDNMLSLRYPVWKAQYTPFGYGLVTIVVPPLRRGDNSLCLWSLRNLSNPVHTFLGHSDIVVDFGWRKASEESKEYELVTWAKDFTLRIWTVDVQLQKSCGLVEIEKDDLEQMQQTHVLLDSAGLESQSNRREGRSFISPPSVLFKRSDRSTTPTFKVMPQNLQQEFSLVNLNIPNITIDEMDAMKRLCVVTVENGSHVVYLKMTFPSNYPFNALPTFEFCKGTNVGDEVCKKLLEVLKSVSQQQVRRNRCCLEPCLRQMVSTLENITFDEKEQQQSSESPFHREGSKQSFSSATHYSLQDASVPFPRTSGARFCGADLLVVFTRPTHLQRINAPTDATPRSLSALAGYISTHVLPMKTRVSSSSPAQYSLVYPTVGNSPSGDPAVSISSFYQQERKQKVRRALAERRSSGPKPQSNCGAVLVYSVAKLIPINLFLAQNYVLYSHDIPGACMKNAGIAAAAGYKDLVQVWSLAGLIIAPVLNLSSEADSDVPWAYHPCGRKLLQSLITYYIKKHDVQTASMLACTFHNKPSLPTTKKIVDIGSAGSSSPGGSPYHTVGVPADNTSESWILGAALKRNRSNSWSDSIEEYRFFEGGFEYRDSEREAYEANSKLLDPKLTNQYDQFKKVYADILYCWNLLEQRAQILKYLSVSNQPEKRKGIDFVTECRHCHKDHIGAQCPFCKSLSFCCAICHIAVKGFASFCIVCGHGGHSLHMEEWFSDMDICPSGCGCKCLEASRVLGS